MWRFELLEPEPLIMEQYAWGSILATGAFLAIWAIVLLTGSSAAVVLVLTFPILLIGDLCMLFSLSGW
jgi:hypothetical protein